MQNYLKKYLDSPKRAAKKQTVVYRKNIIIDNDNIDQLMGRLVDNDQADDIHPVFVETQQSKQIDQKEKQLLLDRLKKQNRQGQSRSRSNSKIQSKQNSESDQQSNSSIVSSDTDSNRSPQKNNPNTIYRNSKTGEQISLDQKLKEEIQKNQVKSKINQRAVDENQKQIQIWGSGYRQQQLKIEKQQEFQNAEGKNEQRQYDLHLIKQDKFADPMRKILQEDDDAKLNTKSTTKNQKKCKFPTIANRYQIEAGHRWDGVDRSNGYERKYLAIQNERKDDQIKQHLEQLKNI